MRNLLRLFLLMLLILVLAASVAACGSDAIRSDDPVFVVATPDASDADFVTYRHASGAFSLRLPPDWIAGELPDADGVRVQFTALEGDQAVTRLSVYLVNTGQPMTPEAFAQAVAAYQPPADLAGYGWQEFDRADMPDGSRRITGVRTYPTLGPRALNIFLQGDGAFFSALELDITDANGPLLDVLQVVANTFRVNTDAELDIGTVEQAAAGVTSYTGVIGFNGYHAWTDRDGVFHLTGEAVNTTPRPLEAIRLSGLLYDAQGRRLAEQSDILSMDVLGPGQGAPFDLRFEGGKPATAVRYELQVAGREAEYALRDFYGPENFRVANQEATYNAQNTLVIRGDLANTGPSVAEAVKVIVAIWDGEGRVVAADTVFVPVPRLVPQEAVSFEVPFYELGGSPGTFTVAVVGTVGVLDEEQVFFSGGETLMKHHTNALAVMLAILALLVVPAGGASAQDPDPLREMTLGRGLVRSVAWSPAGDVIAVGGALGIWLYTPDLADLGLLEGHARAVYGLAFSPDGTRLASASHDLTVRLWDIEQAEQVQQFEGHTDLVVAVDWHRAGRLVASGAYDRTVRLWDAATGEAVTVLEGHTDWVSDVAFSPDGSLLASAGYDGTVRVWNVADWSPVAVLTGHEGAVQAVAWTGGGGLFSAGRDGTVRQWYLETGEPAWTIQAHDDAIYDLAWSPQGFTFATASFDGTVRNWYARDRALVGAYTAHRGRVHHLAWNPAGTALATLGWDDTVRVWDVTRDEQAAVQEEHLDWIRAVQWMADDNPLCALAPRGWTVCWDSESGAWRDALLTALPGLSLPSVPSPDGTQQATIDAGGVVRILDAATGEVLHELPGRANAVAWDSSGARLAVALRNGTVRVVWVQEDPE